MRSIAALTVLVALGVWAAIASLPEGDRVIVVAPPTQEIASVAIDGGPGLPLAQLRGVIATHVGGELDTQALARDRVALQDFLARRGYLAARVASPIVTFGPTGAAYVVFDIDAGPLYHLGEVELVGDDWTHAGVVTLARGDEARGDRLERARQSAEDTLARTGHRVRVDLKLVPDRATALVDVALVAR